MALIGDDWL